MDLFDLTPQQLKRAASIKERIEDLNKELRSILDRSPTDGAASKRKRTMSAAVKRKIAAAQRARWATLRRANATGRSVKSAAKTKPKALSAATRAKLSAKLKAYWAAKRARKK
jgi:N12 class adenine-specific DNA methylase